METTEVLKMGPGSLGLVGETLAAGNISGKLLYVSDSVVDKLYGPQGRAQLDGIGTVREEPVGCLRILSDSYYFGTITEMLVLPAYRKQGIGSELLRLARENTPTMLYFGAQPGVEPFYEKNGCQKGLQSYTIPKKRG